MVGTLIRRSRSGVLVAAAAVLVVVGLSACTSNSGGVTKPLPGASSSSTASPADPGAADAVLIPTGDAKANLPFFDKVNRQLLAKIPTPVGRDLVDNLVTAGFAKADIEVTPDLTVGKETAESIQFSVRINNTCLVGQSGGAGYNAVATTLLGTGKCLVGKTRTIDW